MKRRSLSRPACYAAVALAVPALLVGGCGSGKKSFQDKVNKICREFDSATKGLNLTSVSDLKKGEAAIKKAGNDLKNVKATKDVREKYGATYKQFYANFLQLAFSYGFYEAAVQHHDQASAKRAAGQVKKLSDKSKALATQMGLKDCEK